MFVFFGWKSLWKWFSLRMVDQSATTTKGSPRRRRSNTCLIYFSSAFRHYMLWRYFIFLPLQWRCWKRLKHLNLRMTGGPRNWKALCPLSSDQLVGMGLFPHLARILQLKQAQWPCIVHPQVDNERWEIAFQISSQCCLLENIKYCLQVFKQTLSVRPLREPFKSWLLVSCILPLTFIIIIGSRALDS